MDISGNFQKIIVLIYDKRFVSSLIKMSGAAMFPVKITGIADVEMTHEFGKVAFRGDDQQMKMVGHHRVGQKLDFKDI